MPGLEPIDGLRVVANAAALDGARWLGSEVTILRSAPDEAFAIGATGVDLDDPDAIIQPDVGLVGAWVDPDPIDAHIEWRIPAIREDTVMQGAIAGVPARLWWPDDAGRALLVVHAAYAAELRARLGWDP